MNETGGFPFNLIVRALDRLCDDRISKFLNPTPRQKAIKKTAAAFPQYKRKLPAAFDSFFMDPSATHAFNQLFAGDPDEGHVAFLVTKLSASLSPLLIAPGQARECIECFAQNLRLEFGRSDPVGLLRHQASVTTSSVGQVSAVAPRLVPGQPQDAPQPSPGDSNWDKRIEQTKELIKRGETSRAERRLHAILDDVRQREVESSRLLYRLHINLAICCFAQERVDDAADWTRKALQDQPQDDLAEALMARILVVRGETKAARRAANRVLSRNPTQSQAWIAIILTSSKPIAPTSLPGELRKNSDILLAFSEHYLNHGDVAQALTVAREASRHATTSAQSCVSVAETLLYLVTQPTGDIVVQEDQELIADLLQTAIHLIGDADRSLLLSKAYCIRSGLRLITGDIAGAERDGQRAYRADPTRDEAAYAWVRALGQSGDATRALFVLEQHEFREQDPRMFALRARVLSDIGGRDSEVEVSIRSAIRLLSDAEDDQRVLLDLTDLATILGLTELAEETLARMHQDIPKHMASLFLARIARVKGQQEDALANYSKASSEAPDDGRVSLAYEHASAAHSFGAYSDVVGILESEELEGSPDHIRQMYVHSLVAMKRWDRVSTFLQRMADARIVFGEWALEVASVVALRRDDLEGAVAYLRDLLALAKNDAADVEARLAHALFRMGRTQEAVSFAKRACAREDVRGKTRLDMAKLLFHARHYDDAIRTAFAALRQLPSSSEVDAVYIHIFGTSPEDIPTKEGANRIDVDTWVKFRSDDLEATYWIFGDDVPIEGHDELLASSAHGKTLLGLAVGDPVVLQPAGADPTPFKVAEVVSIWVQAFRDALHRASTRVTIDEAPIQSIRVGDSPSVRFLSTMTAMLHRRQEAQAKVDDLYRDGRVPMAVLGYPSGRTCRETYYYAKQLEPGVLVESGTGSSLADAMQSASSTEAAVLHTSALVTLQELGMLHVVSAVFDNLLIPPSASVELREEKTRILHDLEKGETAWLGLEDSTLVVSHGSPETAKRVVVALDELLEWIESSATEMPRPSSALSDATGALQSLLGAPSHDAYLLAGPDLPLFADDFVLRQLAAGERQASSFSTYSLLCVAAAREAITLDEFCKGINGLIELRHRFVPVSAQVLLYASRVDAYQLGESTKRCLRRLVTGDVYSSATVFASFIRQLAVSDIGRGSVGLVTRYCVSVVKERYPKDPHCLWTYRALAREALRLDPLLLEEVERAFTPES